MEVYLLVDCEKPVWKKILAYVFLVIGIACLSLVFIGSMPMAFYAIFAFVFFYLLQFKSNKEYEYSYFDGDLKFAKIMNKSRRKNLGSYNLNEVIAIAPTGHSSINKYESDRLLKHMDYTSQKADANVYTVITNNNGIVNVIKFEPDEAILSSICMKYGQKVTRA